MDYKLIWVRGHVEVYDSTGNFFCSADNEEEARQELQEVEKKTAAEQTSAAAPT